VGDEFHWTGYWSEGSNWQTIKRVLNKEVFGNYDSVRYTLEHCQITRFPMNPTYIVTVYDTIRETYYFDRMPDDSIIGLLPDALQRDNTTSGDACRFSRKVIFNERQTQESQYRLFHFDNTINPCWSNAMEGGTPVYDYSEGLGVTFYSFVLIDGQVDQRDETMVYYKKGNETWGTPVASGCKQLVPAEVLTKSYRPEIKIKPNPAETLAEITLEGFPPSGLSYSLTNDLGQSVLMLGIHSNPFSLNCAGLPAGLYVLGIMDGNGSILGMKRMIIK
jgi:hypothetical protein